MKSKQRHRLWANKAGWRQGHHYNRQSPVVALNCWLLSTFASATARPLLSPATAAVYHQSSFCRHSANGAAWISATAARGTRQMLNLSLSTWQWCGKWKDGAISRQWGNKSAGNSAGQWREHKSNSISRGLTNIRY